MQNSNMIISIFMFYYQKKGIPSENPFLFRKELYIVYLSSYSPLNEGHASILTNSMLRTYTSDIDKRIILR